MPQLGVAVWGVCCCCWLWLCAWQEECRLPPMPCEGGQKREGATLAATLDATVAKLVVGGKAEGKEEEAGHAASLKEKGE